MQMQLRTHITRPHRYEDSPDPPERSSYSHSSSHPSSAAAMAPKEKLLPKHMRPAFKPPFVEYDSSLPPACFPTIPNPVPKGGDGGRDENGIGGGIIGGDKDKRKGNEREVVIIGSEDEDSGDDGGDEEEDDDVEMPGRDREEPMQEGHLGGGKNSEGVEDARDSGKVIEVDDGEGGTGEESVDSVEESSHAVEVSGRYMEGAVMALKDVAKAMSPERIPASTDVDGDWSLSTADTSPEHGCREDLDGGHNDSMGGDVGEVSGSLDVLVQGLLDAAQTTYMVETGNAHQIMETPDTIGDAVNEETWTTSTPADTGLRRECEDANRNAMFPDAQQVPTPAIEVSGPIGWRDLNISIRIEILANALHELYDMKVFCDDLEIDEEAFQHSCVCLNERTKNLRHEDILIDKAHKEANEVFSTPGWMEDQYYRRRGKYPTTQQKSAFEQQQFHSHTLSTVDRCILRNKDIPQFEQFDQMFHCKQSGLRTAQKFLQAHNYDPRLAGEGWTGGERAALETVLKLDGLSASKKDMQKVRCVADSIGVDLDLGSAPEMIDLLDGPFISTAHYSRPLHLEPSVTQLANPLVRSGSTSSTDSEAERRASRGKLVIFKLPNSMLALRRLRDGVCAVQPPYNLPDRYVGGTGDGLHKVSPPSNLDRRPRGFSPPRWHRRAAPTKGRKRGRSATPRKALSEGHSQLQSGDHSAKEKTHAVPGVQGGGRAIKLKIRVPEGLRDDLVGAAPAAETLSAVTITHDASTQVAAIAPATSLLYAAEVNSVVSTPTTLVEQAEPINLNPPADIKDGIQYGQAKPKNLDFQVDTQASQSRLGHDSISPSPEPLTARISQFPLTETAATPTGANQVPPLSPITKQRAILSLLDKLHSRPRTPPTPSFESITPETTSPPSLAYSSTSLPETNLISTTTGCNQSQAQLTGEGSLITPVSASTENPNQGLPIQAQDISTALGLGIVNPKLNNQVPTPVRPTTPMSGMTTSSDFQTPRTGTTPYAMEKHSTLDASEIPEQTEQDRIPVYNTADEETVLVGVEDPDPPGRGKLPVPRQLERVRSESTRRGKLKLSAPRPPSGNSSQLATPAASKSELDTGDRATSISSFAPTDEDSSSANYMTEDDKAKPINKKRKAATAKKAAKAKPAAPATPVAPMVYIPPKTRRSSSNLVSSEKSTKSSPKKSPAKKAAALKPPQGESTAAERDNVPPATKRRSTRTNTSTAISTIPSSSAETIPTPLSIVDRLGGTPRKSNLATQTQNTTSLGINAAKVPPGSSRSAPGHKRRISLIVKGKTSTPDPSPPSKKPRLKPSAKANPDPMSSDVAPSSATQNQPGTKPRTRAFVLALSETMDGNAESSDLPPDSETPPLPTQPSSEPPPKPTKSPKNATPKPLPHTPLTRSVARAPIHNLRSTSTSSTSAPPAQPVKRARISNVAGAKKETGTPKPAEPKTSSNPNETPTPKKFGWGGRRIAGTGQGNHNRRKKVQKEREA